jgi:hypothetical protein
MRISPILTLLAALFALVVVGLLGVQIVQPARPLLADVSFSLSRITPNADGDSDLTEIRYTLHRTAQVTIAFTDRATGARYVFRDAEIRPADTYSVLFSGVVDGFTLPGETVEGQIEQRLLPDGEYDWTVEAIGDGETMRADGTLIIADGDPGMPLIEAFDVSPRVFTPNQDGYDDRISVNLVLAKPARLIVYLEGADGVPYYIPERFEGREPGEEGAHVFDYDGGVDNNTPPPPDGEYILYAVAQDAVGQRIRRSTPITIQNGGLPNAEIVAQQTGRTVTWTALPWDEAHFTDAETSGRAVDPPLDVQSTQAVITMPQGDLLVFRLTVSNYGTTPLRTIGPWPGTVYTYDQTDAAMIPAASREAISGAWRVGVQCERSESSYPWRWALGPQSALTRVERENETLWYLMPGQRVTVWGAVRMSRLIPTRNPQKCFAALIHEDVEIPPRQNRVGEIDVRLTPVS